MLPVGTFWAATSPKVRMSSLKGADIKQKSLVLFCRFQPYDLERFRIYPYCLKRDTRFFPQPFYPSSSPVAMMTLVYFRLFYYRKTTRVVSERAEYMAGVMGPLDLLH